MTIVEIGPGSLPLFRYSPEIEKKVNSGAKYIGVDLDTAQQKSWCNQDNKFKAFAVGGDLRDIPLPDKIADEAWLMNTLGRIMFNRDELYVQRDGSISMGSSFIKYFTELARILKPQGTLFIGEIHITPKKTMFFMDADYKQFGLNMKKNYCGRSLQKFLSEHSLPSYIVTKTNSYLYSPPFFMSLTKTAP